MVNGEMPLDIKVVRPVGRTRISRPPIWTRPLCLTMLLLLIVAGNSRSVTGQGAANSNGQPTTPFASLPGMSTQQVLRTILPENVVVYSPAVVAEEPGAYRSALKVHNRGMEHLYSYTNMFLALVQPQEIVPPGQCGVPTNLCSLFLLLW